MGFSTEFQNRLQYNQLSSYEILIYIKDTNDKWVDFSDKTKDKKSLLTKIGTISYGNEKTSLSPVMTTSLSQINMDNSNGFWDQSFPTLYTEDGSTANFETTKGSQLSAVEGRSIQFRIKLIIDKKSEINNLLTMMIKNVITNNNIATLQLQSFSQYLKNKSAEGVRDRNGWYQNKPIPFLVRELLKTGFIDSNGDLPKSFHVPNNGLELTDPDSNRVYSILGRPPVGIDTNSDGIPDGYYSSPLIPRCILGGNSAVGSSAFSTDANDITHLYIGCNHKLYRYSIADDSYQLLDSLSDSNFNIRKLWRNPNDNKIWGVAFTSLSTPSGLNYDDISNLYYQNAVVFNCTSQDQAPLDPVSYAITEYYTFNKTNIGSTVRIPYSGWSLKRRAYNAGSDGVYFNAIVGVYDSGMVGGANGGVNVPSLFSHNMLWDKRGLITARTDMKHGDDEDDDMAASSGFSDGYVPRGYIAGRVSFLSSDYKYCTLNHSLNGSGLVLFNPNIGAKGKIIIPRMEVNFYGPTTQQGHKIYISLLDLDSGAFGVVGLNLINLYTTIGYQTVHPITGDTNDNSVWICGVSYTTDTNRRIGSAILHFNMDTFITTTLYENDGYDNTLRIFLECIHYTHPVTSTEYLILVTCYPYLGVSNATSTPLYRVEIFNLTTNTIEKRLASYTSQPYGLIQGELTSGNMGHYIYFVESSSGAIKRIDTSDWSMSALNNNKPITETEFAIYGNMVFDTNTDSDGVLWGISHPNGFVEESQDGYVPSDGKYNLFKYHKKYYPLIELADFSGLNVWGALSLLAQKCYHSIGFDESGNFYMSPKDISSNSVDFTIDDLETPLQIVSKNRSMSDIANVVKIIPNIIKLEPPSFEAILVNDGENRDTFTVGEDEITIRQEGTKSQLIRLFCIRGGDANAGSDTYRHNPLFKFLIYDNILEVKTTSGITSTDVVIYLSTVYGGDDYSGGIHTGDYISIEIESGGELTRRITGGADIFLLTESVGDISFNDSGITINSAFGSTIGSNFDAGSIVKVYKKFREGSSSSSGKQWSDEGVTYVTSDVSNSTTVYVQSVDHLSKNTVVQIEGLDEDIIYERRITDIDTENKKITLSSAISCFTDKPVKAFWSPINASTYYSIGGTNVGLIIESGNDKAEFKTGDIINITCPGLKLERDDRSPQIAYSVDSIKRYGEREHKGISNRFLNRRDGEFMSKYLLNKTKFPAYTVQFETSYMPFITSKNSSNQLTKLAVRSKKAFPNAPNHQIKGYIRKVNHDPLNNKSIFIIKSEDFY